jgi:hypothetical protein
MMAAVLQARVVEVDTAAAAAAGARQAGEKVETDERYYKYLGHREDVKAAIADWHIEVDTPTAAGTSSSSQKGFSSIQMGSL